MLDRINHWLRRRKEKSRKKYKLKIDTLNGKLWCDRDHIILHACFQCLVDFMEKENPDEVVDWEWNEEHRKAWEELVDLYHWWKNIRPYRVSPLDMIDLPSDYMVWQKAENSEFSKIYFNDEKYPNMKKLFEEDRELEMKWLEEDRRNLKRLIDVRGYMWV